MTQWRIILLTAVFEPTGGQFFILPDSPNHHRKYTQTQRYLSIEIKTKAQRHNKKVSLVENYKAEHIFLKP